MMTDGQERAMWQLRHIATDRADVFDIASVEVPSATGPNLIVTVGLRIGKLPAVPGGLRLRAREEFHLAILPDFPFTKPEVSLDHSRFANRPHVQWARHLCLYQSGSEWNASDGMFGLVQRLCDWLTKAAANQLDPDGQPLHPPAVYANHAQGKLVVPRVDTPNFDGAYWVGVAELRDYANRVEIVAWHPADNYPTQGTLALTILFSGTWPWEYPIKGADVFAEFGKQGVPPEILLRMLAIVARDTTTGMPLYTVVGAPMRGVAGGARKQHLAVWSLSARAAEYLAATLHGRSDTEVQTEARTRLQQLLDEWLRTVDLAWCPIMEARPEVTIRRDVESPLGGLRGRSVAVWGCGALGAPIAFALCRAGAARLVLVDSGKVSPGLLVRQPYHEADVGSYKVDALEAQLKLIRPDLVVEKSKFSVSRNLASGPAWASGCDLVIDATASETVRKRTEQAWNRSLGKRVALASLVVDATSSKLLVSFAGANASGASWDVYRKAKVELLRNGRKDFADAFFPETSPTNLFQPEPGCSEPTFRGSAADAGAMAAVGLNLIAGWFAEMKPAAQHAALFSLPIAGAPSALSTELEFTPDVVMATAGLELRISPVMLKEVKGWVAQNRRKRSSIVETGGLLWGEWDDAAGVVWVSAVSGPPSDSRHSAELFLCGKHGTAAENDSRGKQTRGAVQYIGMWHTHPVSRPVPSDVDYEGMTKIFSNGPVPPSKNLLFIFGRMGRDNVLGAFAFLRELERNEIPTPRFSGAHHPLGDRFL
jgi:integrative and conjugative element protein (TIGR02256 family)